MNFRAVLVLPKTAESAQTHKSMSFIWIVWSTLFLMVRQKLLKSIHYKSGASSGFQLNQGKNTKRSQKLFFIKFAYKPQALIHSGTAKKLPHFGYFNAKVQENYNIMIFFYFWWKTASKKYLVPSMLKSPLTSVLMHPGFWFCSEDTGYSIFFSILQRRARIFNEFFHPW